MTSTHRARNEAELSAKLRAVEAERDRLRIELARLKTVADAAIISRENWKQIATAATERERVAIEALRKVSER